MDTVKNRRIGMDTVKKRIKQSLLFDWVRNRKKYKKRLRNKLHKWRTRKIVYPFIYWWYSKKKVDPNKVIFMEVRSNQLTNSFKLLYDELVKNYDFDVHCHFLRTSFVSRKEHVKRCKDFIKDLATAKYVFYNEGSNVAGCITVRKETVLMQTWHGCGAFKKFGFSTADYIFGEDRKGMLRYPNNSNYTYVCISSPEVRWAYAEALNMEKEKERIIPIGSSRTDVFYDPNFIDQAHQTLYKLFPQAKGKKVILYAPTFRGRVAKAVSPDLLNIDMFKKQLSDEYVLIMKHHPNVKKRPAIPEHCKGFAVDFTTAMTIEDLLCVSDICISDYSSLIFEYSLFERPMIFFAYDLENYFDWRGFYYDYDELTPGPILVTNLEMIDYIKHIEERFDVEQVRAFRQKFMSACDGKTTQRVLETVFGDALEQHRRQNALKGEFHMLPNANEMERARAKKRKKLLHLASEGRKAYEKAVEAPVVRKKIAIVYSAEKTYEEDAVQYLCHNLEKEMDLVVKIQDANAGRIREDMEQLATAQFIFVFGECYDTRIAKIRPETTVINLDDTAFPLYKKGVLNKVVLSGMLKEEISCAPLENLCKKMCCSYEKESSILEQSYALKKENILPLGSIYTDLLQNQEFIKNSKAKIKELCPRIGDRKIIYYCAKRRTRPGTTQNELANMDLLREYLYKDYYVFLDLYDEEKQKQCKVPEYLISFVTGPTLLTVVDKTASDERVEFLSHYKPVTTLELLAASDLVIGDYRAQVFDSVVAKKPLLLWAPDYETYLDQEAMNFHYGELLPNAIVKSDDELLTKIQKISEFDYSEQEAFRKKYYTFCDGNVAEKIVEELY